MSSNKDFFSSATSKLIHMERELVAERTKAGLAAAKTQGRIGGRKRKITKSKLKSAQKLLASGVLPKDVARDLAVSIPTLYRWIPVSSCRNPVFVISSTGPDNGL